MTDSSHRTLERIARRVPVPEPAYDRLLRRRDRKERNRRISAAVLAIALTLLSIAGLMRAFRHSELPATEPTPTPVDTGIFSGMGGWIVYGNKAGIWAMDPERPGDPEDHIRVSTRGGEPLAWSSDGSKLLILRRSGNSFRTLDESLSVLNADGSETILTATGAGHDLSGGSFSPDGSKVVYVSGLFDRSAPDGIYVVDAAGGTPRRLLVAVRRLGNSQRSWLSEATFSPDGSQIAYIDGMHDHSNSLRVMNVDGSGSHVILEDDGVMQEGFLEHLVWSPDGRHLAFDFAHARKIYVVGADGSGLTLVADGVRPAWSPDGLRIAYAPIRYLGGAYISGRDSGTLLIADADGTHVQQFNGGGPGPWNPLDRSGEEVPEALAARGRQTLTSTLLLVAGVLAVIAGIVFIRRRMVHRSSR
jgi:hypothetical protein